MKIWIVDAFAKEPYTGNPAAVAIVDDFPDHETCQKIATEMNLSETAFIKPLTSNHFHLRWFTPKVEVDLCGHATLAAAHILKQEKLATANKILFESRSGPLRVTILQNEYILDFPLQKVGPKIESPLITKAFGEVVQAVQAYDDVIVEVESVQQLRNYVPRIDELSEIHCRGIILTSKGNGPYDFESRFFGPRVGVNEDPVTGSAHCKLADYWQKKLNKNHFLAYQASTRGGEIKITIVNDRVLLTGRAITILEGEWQVHHE